MGGIKDRVIEAYVGKGQPAPTVQSVFIHLAKSAEYNEQEYFSVQVAHAWDEVAFHKIIVEMCDLGLVRIDSKDGSKGFIVKTDAFYKAQRLGIGAWIRQNENDTKRERKKIKHDARGSWAKANFWWVSLAALALSLWALVRSYLG